ncbi:MAG: serine acetyltransferase [Acetatifactor sp.]|nr:serine acetyltransferase [Acetatifactor sp.]
MSNNSIFRDYYHFYSNRNFLTKIKIFLKAFCIPSDPTNKICPWIRMELNAYKKKNVLLEKICEWVLLKKFFCVVGSHCEIGEELVLPHPMGIVIGHGVKIGKRCVIYHQATLGQSKSCFPSIGDDVVIFAGAKIVGDVKVGDNVVIGANAVVTRDIPSNSVVAGNPAAVIKKITNVSEYRMWWNNGKHKKELFL